MQGHRLGVPPGDHRSNGTLPGLNIPGGPASACVCGVKPPRPTPAAHLVPPQPCPPTTKEATRSQARAEYEEAEATRKGKVGGSAETAKKADVQGGAPDRTFGSAGRQRRLSCSWVLACKSSQPAPCGMQRNEVLVISARHPRREQASGQSYCNRSSKEPAAGLREAVAAGEQSLPGIRTLAAPPWRSST